MYAKAHFACGGGEDGMEELILIVGEILCRKSNTGRLTATKQLCQGKQCLILLPRLRRNQSHVQIPCQHTLVQGTEPPYQLVDALVVVRCGTQQESTSVHHEEVCRNNGIDGARLSVRHACADLRHHISGVRVHEVAPRRGRARLSATRRTLHTRAPLRVVLLAPDTRPWAVHPYIGEQQRLLPILLRRGSVRRRRRE
ncbi:hypothetical protein DQ04_12271010 [Trypanosoma grayi]|uniref:hypothetical protein n=1 Tax=Trypanosoma grayi TaxID=71804 RepID=UPI0004F40EBF|nr:hypothetical protein DQ04_12271010 [Trypanosoma grayi]KEG06781.1 hypothetical protein DQ04_12271010 [Trypanosoma grayi]